MEEKKKIFLEKDAWCEVDVKISITFPDDIQEKMIKKEMDTRGADFDFSKLHTKNYFKSKEDFLNNQSIVLEHLAMVFDRLTQTQIKSILNEEYGKRNKKD